MTETTKTFAFIIAASASLAGAYFVEIDKPTFDAAEYVGKIINEDIDPAAPRRLKIVKFDPASAETRQFEVAEVDGVWSLPSKENYPADATKQMAEAATCVIDRKILRVAGQTGETHEEFGVVDPLAEGLNSKSKGVGTRVLMTDADNNTIVDLIIGKKVKDSENQYYVRRDNQDFTYIVELDPSKMSTNFADWIEGDLLKLSAFDIRKVFVNDYSADLEVVITAQGPTARVNWDRREKMTLGYDDEKSTWTALDLEKFDDNKGPNGEMVPDKLGPDEEVNQEKLNALRTALDDLLIVDVAKKPAGLSKDLKAGADFMTNQEAFADLVQKGFSPVPLTPGGDPEILSSEGEAIVTQKDGVEYVLRFGKLKVQTDGEAGAAGAEASAEAGAAATAAADAAKKAKKDDQKSDAANLRRYLFVMARFNGDVVEQPKLEKLPDLPPEKKEEPAGAEASAAASGDTATETDASKEDKAKSDAEDAERESIIAQRKALETENQRKLDEYNETVKSGKKKVDDLNHRFGDWYYVISNDVYKQIHLSRGDVIKKKDAPAKDGAAAAVPAPESPTSGLPSLPAAQ